MAVATPLDRLVSPLDALRRFVFVEALRVPGLGRVLARRDSRLLAQSCLGVSFAFVLTMVAPGVLYVLGPAILGVPHVVSELRFLIVRRAAPRPWLAIVLGGAALLIALRVAQIAFPTLAFLGRTELAASWGLGLLGAVLGGVSARTPRRAVWVAFPLATALVWSVAHPGLARLLFAHAHNVITIALWVWLFRRRPLFALPALALIAVAAVFFASGAAVSHVRFEGAWVSRLVDDTLSATPRLVPQRVALGLGLAFVFLQSIHYAVWLSWVPQEDLPTEGTTSFRMSVRSLARDLGRTGLVAVLAVGTLVLAASALDVHRTRALYLSLATFHGYVEVAMLAFFVARGTLPRSEARR